MGEVAECRRCSECVGQEHHWIEWTGMLDEDGRPDDYAEIDIDAPFYHAGFVCKHCDAIADMCMQCSVAIYPRTGTDECSECRGD